MVRYFYSWTPLVIVGLVVLLSLPWLGVIALMAVVVTALAALAWVIVFLPYALSMAMSRRWRHMRSGAAPRTAAALSPAGPESVSDWQGPLPQPAALSVGHQLQAAQKTFAEATWTRVMTGQGGNR